MFLNSVDTDNLLQKIISTSYTSFSLFGLYFMRADGLKSTNADAGLDRRDAEAFDTQVQPPKSD